MAQIIGGIGISHTPSMGVEYDRGTAGGFDPRWRLWFDGTRAAKDWIARMRPTRIVVIYNDHLNHFTFEAYPTLAIGVADEFPQADEGWGPRPLPDLPGDTAFGWDITERLVRAGFDLTVCQQLAVDHGVYSWFPYLFDPPWPVPILPIAVNMIRHPLPTIERMWQLGAALRTAIAASPAEERVLIIATGGMSHQISGARFGMANEDFDRYFLRELQHRYRSLMDIGQAEYMRLGGVEAAELSIWFAMRGALSDRIEQVHAFYTFPQITGCGVLVFEEPAGAAG
ncbi:MAG TPA: class III extradiol dioxygenase family protein [Sphingomonadaceae bacterium]|nr:class III extradiol dioxygenase family protein [Sphingomonadaceae bacterium]